MVPANEVTQCGEDHGSLSVSAPGGWKARLHGADTKTVLMAFLLAIMFGVAAYEWDQDRRSDKEVRSGFFRQHETTHLLLKQVLQNQNAIIDLYKSTSTERREDIGEMTYLLSLPQARREALKLEMPGSLRRKLNER